MNKNFTTLKGNIGGEVQDSSAAFATIIGRFINRRYFQVLRAINWQNFNDDYTFDTVSGQQKYVLPDDFKKEINCSDITNDKELARMELSKLREEFKDISDNGTVERYCIIDDCVQEQPSAASYLVLKSSSSVDNQSIAIRGISSGVEMYETLALLGTSNATSANQYTRIKGISKSAETTGYITITSDAAANTQAILSPTTLESRYKLALLHYVPSGAYTIAMPYIINPMPLSQDYDYPVIDVADLIELGALADCQRYKRQFGKAQAMEIQFNQQLQEYIFDKENQPNMIYQMTPEVFNRDDTV